jgi:spore germination protein YaaH
MTMRPKFLKILLASLLALALADYFTYDAFHPLKPAAINSGNNGLWLRYYWAWGKHTDAEQEALVERLRAHQIKYAYFHVLDTKSDGTLSERKETGASKITALLRSRLPETKSIAWVYVASFGKNKNDLSNPAVRKNLIDQARWLTEVCGFDGIQWDYEFCFNGDAGFIKLMEETRQELPNAFLSTATPMWYPGTLWGWSDAYYGQVARHADQIAVMCYDSWFYLPRAYVWLVAQQAVHVTQAARDTRCKVILGLPVYEDATVAHHKSTENLFHGLIGVYQGMADPNTIKDRFEGIALFADYTTDEQEWQLYDHDWRDVR